MCARPAGVKMLGSAWKREPRMFIDKIVFIFTGLVMLASVVLGYFYHPLWLLLGAFMGLNLVQAAFTGFCPLAYVMKKAGFESRSVFG
jgi:hypothetical protein